MNASIPAAARQRAFTFAYYMTSAVLVTCLPLYFDSLGLNKLQIGSIYAMGPMIGLVANVFWGVASDRLQAVKLALNIVFVGQFLCVLCLFASQAYPVLLALMTIFFFFQTPTSSLNDSLTLLTLKGTGRSYASFRVYGSLGFAFSSLVFGYVLQVHGAGAAVYLPIATVGASLLLTFTLPDVQAGLRKSRASKGKLSDAWRMIFSKKASIFFGALLIISVAHRMNDVFLALYLRGLGANESMIGLSWAISALGEIPVFYLFHRYGQKFSALTLLSFASAVYVVRNLIMASVSEPAWVLPVQALNSVSFGVFYLAAIRYFQQLVPDRFRATGQAAFAVVWSSLGGMLSGATGGWLFEQYGGRSVFVAASALAAVALAAFALMRFRDPAAKLNSATRGGEQL
jgi:PPP family 3-phenylpropionic acid transporter